MSNIANDDKKQPKKALLWLEKHKIIVIIASAALLLAVSIVTIVNVIPARSAENFCKVFRENKSTFTGGNSNYQTLVDAYDKLEKVSPDEISPDVKRIKTGYQSTIDDPSKSLGVGFGIMGETNRLNDYINKNCSEN